MRILANKQFYNDIKNILIKAREKTCRAINFAMVEAYWNIGRLIVEEEQKGQTRADYGKNIIKLLANYLTREFGKGFTQNNLWYMRQFYLVFPILHALRGELSWTHYRLLVKIENAAARKYYLVKTRQEKSQKEGEKEIRSGILCFSQFGLEGEGV